VRQTPGTKEQIYNKLKQIEKEMDYGSEIEKVSIDVPRTHRQSQKQPKKFLAVAQSIDV
jgi:hypothetical protein